MKSYRPRAPRWWLAEQQRLAEQAQDEQKRINTEQAAHQKANQERRARVWAAIRAIAKWAWRAALITGAVAAGFFILLVVAFDALTSRSNRR